MARFSGLGRAGVQEGERLYRQRSTPAYDEGLRRRLGIMLCVVLLSFAVLLVRTWQLQVVQGEHFLQLSEQNRLRSLRTKSLRGKILDRHGQVLADNRAAYTLMAMPADLPPPEQLLPLLRTLNIDLDPDLLRPRRRMAAFKPVPIQRDVPRDQVAYFAEHRMDFPGMFIEVEPLRTYPYGTVAAHLLGYLGEINEQQLQRSTSTNYYLGDLIGQAGLEQAHEAELRGQPGLRQVEVDALGRETQVIAARPAKAGFDLVLTLDLALQQLAEHLLEPHRGSIVALDPRNGQILALASQPAFDPNAFVPRPTLATWRALSTDPRYPLHNRATQGQYPPGSVFKIVTALAALAEGVVTPQTSVCCPGYYDYGEHTFRDWKPSGHGCVQLRLALAQSCDVYFYHVGQLLGVDRIAHYAHAFGLGQPTGFAPGLEKAGLVPSSQWKRRVRNQPWYAGETLSVAIGQGYTTTTPLQVANMVATLANGGTLYRPSIVLRQESVYGADSVTLPPTVLHQLRVAPQHIAAVQQGLWSVVNDAKGTGKQAHHGQIAIAGKTGTAQVVALPEHDASPQRQALLPEQHRHHAWFAAYAPFEAPRIAVVIMIEHAGKGGGQFAGYAKTLIEAYLRQADAMPSLKTTKLTP
ncbi:MAG: penicillin-binding protein 2 [Candidatus Tectimicrobiota bacterium]